MRRVFESKKVCATMFLLFGLSVAVNSFAGGSLPSFGSSPALVPDAQHQIADSPFGGGPDPFDRPALAPDTQKQMADSPFGGGPDPFDRPALVPDAQEQIADSPFGGGPDPFERDQRA